MSGVSLYFQNASLPAMLPYGVSGMRGSDKRRNEQVSKVSVRQRQNLPPYRVTSSQRESSLWNR